MNSLHHSSPGPRKWVVALAFCLVYLSWGTTYLAIKVGVASFPPALFAGTRVLAAGILVMGFLALRGDTLRVRWIDFWWTAGVGLLMFIGGNGLLTFAERSVPSGIAAVIGATSPFWVAVFETLWPWGERLRLRGWVGLGLGLAGVTLLLAPQLGGGIGLGQDLGPPMVVGSTLAWAMGSFVIRHRRMNVSHLASAGYQMVVGGLALCLGGLVLGEASQVSPEQFNLGSVYAFVHLLIFGSLVGFVAYNWLVSNVSATMAQTYAYVNPVIAILVGNLVGHETITGRTVTAMAVILIGVNLVRHGAQPVRPRRKPAPTSVEVPPNSRNVPGWTLAGEAKTACSR